MRRLFKALAWGAGIVVALLIAAALYIFLIFDPNKYKAEITSAVHKATGRELTIQGDLKLSLFPWLGVETGGITLDNLPEFGQQPFAKIDGAAIKVKLLPLLHKDVEVDSVTLNGLYLNLIRTTAGRGNWEDLTTGGGKQPSPASSAQSAAAPMAATLAIGGVRIQNATVIWDDRQNQTHYELSELSLHTGPVSPSAPVTLAVTTQIKSTAPALTAHLDLGTQALYEFDAQQLHLTGLKLTIAAQGQALPVDETKLTLTTDAVINFPTQQYQLSKLKLLASLHGEQLPGKQVDATLDANVAVDLKQGTLRVDPLNLQAWNVKVQGSLQGQGLLTTPRFSGVLSVPGFNARELLGHFGGEALNTADKQTLTAVSADVAFNASTAGVELTKLAAKLDQTQIGGKASIANFSHPAYRFQLAVDDIDADRYLPPATTASAKPVTPATAAGAGAAELPLATLRSLDVDGNLTLGKLKIAKLKLSDIKLGINAAGGVIRAKPLAAQLYGGSYRGDLRLDARSKTLQLGMDETLSAIEIGPLSRDLLQKDLVAGTGNVRLQLTGTGISPEELKRTVTGNIGFSLQNGRVNGINLLDVIQKDYVKYVQSLAIDAGKLNQTVFSKFAATAKVDKGLITTDDLVLDSAQLNVKGRGHINLADESLAMHLDAVPMGQLAKQLGQFKDTVIPIRIEGTFSAPKFATDLDEVFKQQLKARLDREKQKAQAELQRKVDEEKAKLQQKLKQQQDQAEKKLQEQLQHKLKDLFK
jgi:AsmA protein